MQHYIDRLEAYSRQLGATVVRTSLGSLVSGQVQKGRLVLRTGLTKEQQVLTLVHELTHLLVHCGAVPRIDRTICEYEAQAAERLVGVQLGLACCAQDSADLSATTDDLLACSVARVRHAAQALLRVAREGCETPASRQLEAQAAVQVQAAPREEVVLDDELSRVRNLVGLT